MTAAEIASWHAILIATVVVLIANALIGFSRPAPKNGWIAFVQACTVTVLLLLPEITSRTPDGQAAIGIPFFLILFSIVAWIGLALGGSLARKAPPARIAENVA